MILLFIICIPPFSMLRCGMREYWSNFRVRAKHCQALPAGKSSSSLNCLKPLHFLVFSFPVIHFTESICNPLSLMSYLSYHATIHSLHFPFHIPSILFSSERHSWWDKLSWKSKQSAKDQMGSCRSCCLSHYHTTKATKMTINNLASITPENRGILKSIWKRAVCFLWEAYG